MGVKAISVSADDVTYYTLPGNSGELRNEAGQLADTIFGQAYQSTEIGLISGSVQANALYKGFAGYIVSLLKGGTPVVMTNEAMSLVSGKTYVITSTTKQFIDTETTIVVKDNAVDHTADVLNIDFNFGTVTFKSAYTPTGPITITGAYIPTTAIAGAKTFTLTQSCQAIDNSDIPTVKANGGYRTFQADGLKTVQLEIGGVWKTSNAFATALAARSVIFVEICPDNASLSVARGRFKYAQQSQQGEVGALEQETIMLTLAVPQAPSTWDWVTPFSWKHSVASKLSQAVQKALTGFLNGTSVYIKYLADGTNGFKSAAVVTDISLQGGLESMNEFTANFQLSGAPTAIP